MIAHRRAIRGAPAVLLGTVAALLAVSSPATADGDAWMAQVTASGDLVISGSPSLDTSRAWAPGDSSQTSLTVRNDFDRTITVSLAAHVDGPEAAREALTVTAGDDSALAPGGAGLAVLPVGGTTLIPVEVVLPLSSGNASQDQTASIAFTVHAVETSGQDGGPGESTDPSTPPTQVPAASSPDGSVRSTQDTPSTGGRAAQQPGPSTLARTGADAAPWWILSAAGLICLGLIAQCVAARRRAGKPS